MTDEFACVCNLIDDELQRDWYKNGEKYSHEAVEAALHKAYRSGARKHQPNYSKCLELIDTLKTFGKFLDESKSHEFYEQLQDLENNLHTSETVQIWLFHHKDYDHVSDWIVGSEEDANKYLNESLNKNREDFWIEGPLELDFSD